MRTGRNDVLIETLKDRFANNMRRHTRIEWNAVQAKLDANPEKIQALFEMERTGGEPDVVAYDKKQGSLSSVTAHPKAQQVGAAFAMTAARSTHEKKTNRAATH